MEGDQISSIIIFFICMILSAFYSSSETAFTSANIHKLTTEADDGDRQAQRALELSEHYDQLLSTILIGNNIVNIASSAVATIFFVNIYPVYGPTIATIVTTLILLIVGEITPKSIGKLFPELIAKKTSFLLKFMNFIFYPLVWLLSKWQKFVYRFLPVDNSPSISEDEILSIVQTARTEGSIKDYKHDLVRAAMRFDDIEVSQIITPRVDLDGLDINDSLEEMEKIYDATNHTRLVVYNELIDNVVGTVHERDFNRFIKKQLNQPDVPMDIHSIISRPHFVPMTMVLSDLLPYMQTHKIHLVYVIDEFGSMRGIVTMEDILERLVGDIWDEHDEIEEEIIELIPGQKIHVSGLLNLQELYDYFDMRDDPDWDSTTVAGLIMEILQIIPEKGDQAITDNLVFTVEHIANGRIISAIVEYQPTQHI